MIVTKGELAAALAPALNSWLGATTRSQVASKSFRALMKYKLHILSSSRLWYDSA